MATQELIQNHLTELNVTRTRLAGLGVRGPWEEEDHRGEFKHAGMTCLINRNHMLAWCGYVGVTPKHPEYKKHYDAVNVSVHGGLTYSDVCRGVICHITEKEDDLYWFGFDCGHAWDVTPALLEYRKGWPKFSAYDREDVYRDVRYVTEEVKDLAEQLALLSTEFKPYLLGCVLRVKRLLIRAWHLSKFDQLLGVPNV